jgi:ribosomal protein L28
MSKVCVASGKKTVFGRSIQHKSGGKWSMRAPKTNRTFKANVRTFKVLNDAKQVVKVNLSMKAYKRLRKDGVLKIKGTDNKVVRYYYLAPIQKVA